MAFRKHARASGFRAAFAYVMVDGAGGGSKIVNRITTTILVVAALLAGATALAAQVSIGIRIGPPPPPRVVHVVPERPGPDFSWIAGYWYPVGNHYKWHEGYWTRPPYEGAHWVPARHDGERFHEGYWDGEHGRVEHDHRSDRDHDRDYRNHERYEHDRDDHDRGDRDRGDHDR
jgi:WXXGXW repeat (2 copies)